MDRKEAEKITADGGCEYCVSELLDLFCKNLTIIIRLKQELPSLKEKMKQIKELGRE